jgi:deglycase
MASNGRARRRVACVLASDFEDSEYRVPAERLRDAGYSVDIIGIKAGEKLRGKKGEVEVISTRAIDDTRADDYDALLIPGGYSPDHLRADARFVELVRSFDSTRRPLAAVCHGPQLLLAAHLVKGRTLTAWKTIQDDLRQAGANVRDQQVVVDGNWITSRQPEDLAAFSDRLIEELGRRETAALGSAATVH